MKVKYFHVQSLIPQPYPLKFKHRYGPRGPQIFQERLCDHTPPAIDTSEDDDYADCSKSFLEQLRAGNPTSVVKSHSYILRPWHYRALCLNLRIIGVSLPGCYTTYVPQIAKRQFPKFSNQVLIKHSFSLLREIQEPLTQTAKLWGISVVEILQETLEDEVLTDKNWEAKHTFWRERYEQVPKETRLTVFNRLVPAASKIKFPNITAIYFGRRNNDS